jgi:hypothetical protein
MKRGLTILATAFTAVAFAPGNTEERFVAVLDGSKAVPPVVTTAGATANFTVLADTAIQYELQAARVRDVWSAGIYTGTGKAVTLYVGPDQSVFTGTLAKGTLTDKDALGGMTVRELADLMRRKRAYVEIHTAAHPEGELRGQIVPVAEWEQMVAMESKPSL